MARISWSISTPPNVINKGILNSIANDLNSRFMRRFPSLRPSVGKIVSDAILGAPEYASLIAGTLRGELGVPDAATKVPAIVSKWVNGMVLRPKRIRVVGNKFTGGFDIFAVRSDFSDVTSMPEAFQVTEKGQALPWLQWLLLSGDQIIVKQHFFIDAVLLRSSAKSRTGQGIMRPSNVSGWRVPPEFAGSVNNNWITRALNDQNTLTQLRAVIQRSLGL